MNRLSAFGALLALAFLSSCMCGAPERTCTSSSDCDPGERCAAGTCRGGSATGGGTGTGGSGTGGQGTGGQGTGGDAGGIGTGGTGGGFLDFDAGEEDAGLPPYDGGCGPIMAGNPPYPRRCAPPTANECDAVTDQFLTSRNVPASRLNAASSGNGFDDDCDGLVDEGCSCSGSGTTKDCYLVPATQADAMAKPVGWCATNAKGSLDCAGSSEFASWSGVCRGAQQPARFDSCGPGDFDCDGLSGNNQTKGCMCPNEVTCPTAPVVTAPYPDPAALAVLDGTQWIQDVAQRNNATGWTWTVLGGDCDNVLPNPTFALYSAAAGVAANQKGSKVKVKLDPMTQRYVVAPGEPLAAIRATGAGVTGRIYPAFGLSGDYLVQGEFTLGGMTYSCTQRVEVRAPGIRAELCWDTAGNRDVDLHFARLQGATCSTGKQGFLDTCGGGGASQDCHYQTCTGTMSWGYTQSANSACKGWSSKRGSGSGCDNPRLDRDNVSCDVANTNPADPIGGPAGFCGPENINLDNPNDQDKFVVGVNFFNGAANGPARPHVNLYCNGRRVLSAGYNPATGQTSFPLLKNSGSRSSGDFWKVATIKANAPGGALTSCDVETLPSRFPDPTRDGPMNTSVCVDSKTNASAAGHVFNYVDHAFINANSGQGITGNGVPMTAAQWCKH